MSAGEHLELQHRVLGNLRGDAGASGVFVEVLIGGVVAIGEKYVAAGDAAERHQPKNAVGHHRRSQQDVGIDAASVDREIEDLGIADDLRDSGSCLVNGGRGFLHR